jgi:cell division GTPase FtsZ
MQHYAVVGVGGCGTNLVRHLAESWPQSASQPPATLSVDLDKATNEIVLVGTGQRRVFSETMLENSLNGAEKLVVMGSVAGVAGGILAPFFLTMARIRKIPAAAVLVSPLAFEGKDRRHDADRMASYVRALTDTVIEIQDDTSGYDPSLSLLDFFRRINDKALREALSFRR